MGILEQIRAKNKALSVIDSCITLQHIEVCEKYISLYYDLFEDFLGYNELKSKVNKKYISLLNK